MLLHIFDYDEASGLALATPAQYLFDKNKPVFNVYSPRRIAIKRTYSFKPTFKWIKSGILIRHELDTKAGYLS